MPQNDFLRAVASMEQALADVLSRSSAANASSADLHRLLKLIIKKEIVLEFLLEEFPFPDNGVDPEPPAGCETCSIFYNRGSIDAVLNIPEEDPVNGMADPLRIRFCPCNNPDRNEVVLQFNADNTAINDFRFEGFITAILSCDAATDNAVFTGEGSINGQVYDVEITITTDNLGNQTITFDFTNQNNSSDTFTVVMSPSSSSPDQRIDIVDCTAAGS
ncbi:hypothetical protein [Virgibacillus sp. SK37]|uniref:hypothetical protein n=1 Tax=Virgibacillus sp. SK37 TaxID=403957 RepID=UPI0004D19349|nr:hypothetical protein [Virgibacillus sp. SK37]AIF45488.1 hypothetical protein X953_13875 [Virgibacillus sp. SK37]